MTNEQRINLIKGISSQVDIHYDPFTIKNNKIFTKHLVKHWSFKFDKRIIKYINEYEIDTIPYGF